MTTFILAVDHRNSLRGWLKSLGVAAVEIDPTARQLKRLCVSALQEARDRLEPTERPMLLLDEEYGVDAIPAARQHGLPFVIPAERSGREEFLFEHGEGFGEAIELADPDAVKALVRYNVAGDAELNRRSAGRLTQLQSHLHTSGRGFMLEVLVPPTADQAAAHGERFDEELRPELTVQAIDELAASGLRPDWWKLEGNNDRGAAATIAAAGSATAELGCLVLGRGQDRDSVVCRSPHRSTDSWGSRWGARCGLTRSPRWSGERLKRARWSTESRPPTSTSRPPTAIRRQRPWLELREINR